MLTTIKRNLAERKWKTMALIMALVLGAFFRFWGTFEYPTYLEDEALHVPSAKNIGLYGTTAKQTWVYPPLSGEILSGTISLLGDNPYGWRIGNAVLGTASIGLVYLIGELLFPGTAVSVLAASLLAFDPYHAYFSRTTYMEIPLAFFFLSYCYLMLAYSERGRSTLPLAGIALGLTAATKANYVLAIPVVALYAAYRARERGERTLLIASDFAVSLLFLPIAVFLLSYAPWFGRGYTFPEFIQMLGDAYRFLQRFTTESWALPWYLNAGGSNPWVWFLKPWVQGFDLTASGEDSRFLLQINNFPFRMLLFPSLFYVAYGAVRQRAIAMKELFLPVLVFSCYVLVFLVKRPMYGHSALAIVPFAYLATARAAVLLGQRTGRVDGIPAGMIAAAALWGLYTFPLISARAVPLALYLPILSITHIFGGL